MRYRLSIEEIADLSIGKRIKIEDIFYKASISIMNTCGYIVKHPDVIRRYNVVLFCDCEIYSIYFKDKRRRKYIVKDTGC